MIALALLPLAFADRALVGTTGSTDLHDQAAALGGTARGCFHSAGVCVLHFDGDAPLDALAALGGVRYAVADTPMLLAPPPAAPAQPPSDASGTADCPDLWDLDLLEAEAVWARVRGAEAPVIAVQDGGFLESHVELADRVSGRFDYGDWDTTPEVETQVEVPAHGTFIAAMLAGVDDNDAVRAGLAPDGLLNLQKIADSDGALYWSYAISAMADLADGDLGVRVLNYSLGSHGEHQGFEDAVEALGHAGILVVTAAGNCSEPDCSDADNDQYPMIPAGYPFDHVVAVAGTQRDDTLNPYSHYGAISVDLGAPGVDLCSAGVLSDTDSYTAGGTSYATPLVAAAAALIWELHQELTPTELARVLRASALDVPELAGKVRSGGRLDVLAALDTAVPRLEAPPDVFVDGTGELALQLMNPAATGDGMLVLFHGPELVIDWADEDWSVQPFSAGETLSLPDAGTVTVDTPGALLAGPLYGHGTRAMSLGLRGQALGTTEVTARLVVTSPGADYLNAPYASGEADPTGFLAWSFAADVTGTADLDTATPVDPGHGEVPSGCGCTSRSGPAPLVPWLAVLVVGWRRSPAADGRLPAA